ncbi:methionyl-tRNA formyltransferase [Cellulomonas denverensis]|uniref:Methionyl-tRNA formyltransferase n=1 Tax=Cellulomonas denverensis TaxID=264297 RepID=A0A7X6QYD8_9CELL|nr:methionyl-tRNA formyltransferase [Cellulomonas denverensis]NKY21896.1 methionyl-tRNA formyltransferase [Cellulomonas denverensis]GIG24214.1 methionyl-tRNA formyltransferase [Cellulomonas denverensis]
MRLIFAGTPAVALPSLEALLASRHEVVAVLTRPAARAGRGRSLRPSPVAERAAAEGIEVLTPVSPRDLDFQARLRELAPDAVPVVAYGALVPAELLDLPTHGWINLHFSVLPAWRGAAPVQHAVMAGDEVTGASTFLLEKGLDTGPVFGTLTETIRPRDTAGDLLGRLSVAGAELLVRTLDALEEGILTPVPQPGDGISLAPSLSVEDARVRWTHPAQAVDRRIRGCTPAPGAWTSLPDGTRLGLGPVTPVPEVTDLAPGELQAGRKEVLVGTASHAVRLGEVRPAGKKAMNAADWARGARLPESVLLGAAENADGAAGSGEAAGVEAQA